MKTYNLAVKAARQIILAEIDELRKQLCAECSSSDYHKSRCTCEASAKIIELGELYQNKDNAIKYAKGESIVKVEKVEKTITVEEYEKLKSDGKTDKQITKDLGWHSQKFYDWKRKHGLVNSHKKKPKKEVVKSDDYQTLKEQYDQAVEIYEGSKKEFIERGKLIIELANNLDEVKTQLGYALQWEGRYNQLKEKTEKSLDWEKEYRKLEIDYRNEVHESKRLKDMLGNLKYTEQINVYLMERHVGFMKQLDEVSS